MVTLLSGKRCHCAWHGGGLCSSRLLTALRNQLDDMRLFGASPALSISMTEDISDAFESTTNQPTWQWQEGKSHVQPAAP
jgi:hypothetical protein